MKRRFIGVALIGLSLFAMMLTLLSEKERKILKRRNLLQH